MSDDTRTDDGDPMWLRNLRRQATGSEPLHEASVRAGAAFATAEIDRLRAELDRYRAAGDEVVAGARVQLDGYGFGLRLDRAVQAWESAVRGDAPTDAPTQFADDITGTSVPVTTVRRRIRPEVPAAATTDGQAPADADEVRRLRAIERAASDAALNAEWDDDGEAATLPGSAVRALVMGLPAADTARPAAAPEGSDEPRGFDPGARVRSGHSGRHGVVVEGDACSPDELLVRFDGEGDAWHVKRDVLHPVDPKPAQPGPDAEQAGGDLA